MNLLFFLLKICVLFGSNSGAAVKDRRTPLTNTKSTYKVVCYYTNWAQYRNEPAKYFPENIDPFLCTHIIFAFAKINEDFLLSSYEVIKNLSF